MQPSNSNAPLPVPVRVKFKRSRLIMMQVRFALCSAAPALLLHTLQAACIAQLSGPKKCELCPNPFESEVKKPAKIVTLLLTLFSICGHNLMFAASAQHNLFCTQQSTAETAANRALCACL